MKLFHIPPRMPDCPGFCSAQLALRSSPGVLRFKPWRPANCSAALDC